MEGVGGIGCVCGMEGRDVFHREASISHPYTISLYTRSRPLQIHTHP